MAIATEAVTPQATTPAAIGSAAASPAPAAQAPAATPVAPETTEPKAPADTTDWKARHDKLIAESIPALQSQLSREETTRKELEGRLAKLPENLEDYEYEILHEREVELVDWLADVASKGFTLKQAVDHLNGQMRAAGSERAQFETKRQTIDGVIGIVDGYDKGFSEFLRKMDKNGARVANETLPSLRELYLSFSAGGNTPAQAAAAATAQPSAAAATSGQKEPPVVAPAGGTATRMPAAPAWKPGMSARELIGNALKGTFGSDFTRTQRPG